MSNKMLKNRNSGGKLITHQTQQSQKRKFSPGGYLVGKSHEEGGIAAWIGDEEIEVEDGEFIIKKKSVDKYGTDFMHRLNQGLVSENVKKMKKGGRANKLRQRELSEQKLRKPTKPKAPIVKEGQCNQNPTLMCPPPSPGYSGDWYDNCCDELDLQ
jgi:hypothetical protein